MKKIIICGIILIIIILVFKNKIEFFKSYPDASMKSHDKWISDTINYISIERSLIIKCLDIIKEKLLKDNLNQIIKNFNDSHTNNVILSNRYIIDIVTTHKPNVDPNQGKLFKFLEQYLQCNINYYETTLVTYKPPSSTGTTAVAGTTAVSDIDSTSIKPFKSESDMKCSSLVDEIQVEKKYNPNTGKIVEIKKPLFIELIYHYFFQKDIESLYEVLLNIFEEKYIKQLFQYNNNVNRLPCLIYDKSNCPITHCEYSDADKMCHPKYTHDNPPDNSVKVDSCHILSQYGQKICEATQENNGNFCVFDKIRNKCLSNNSKNKPIECHEINNDSQTEFQTNCESLKNDDDSPKCTYKNITKGDKSYNYCYDKNPTKRSPNICYSFSNTDETQIPPELNCNINKDLGSTDFYSIPKTHTKFNLQNENLCHLFDNSDTKDNEPKNLSQKININSIELQKSLCEGLLDERGNNKCKFVEHNTYVSNNNNDQKYRSKFTKCLDKNKEVDASYINTNSENESDIKIKKIECLKSPNNIWSNINKMCINKNSSCNDIKYKNLCKYNDNCYWHDIGIDNSNPNDNFERGVCRDINTNEIERIIDIVHRKEMDKLVKLKKMEETITDFKKKINSQQFLEKWPN